jgi:tetratricopeptide (TPR) repeat protein
MYRSIFCFLVSLYAWLPAVAWAAPKPETELVARARLLVDTYYGDPAKLREAAALIGQAYAVDSEDSHVYVQAARITVMGAMPGSGGVEPSSLEAYASLLDKAIALDPDNSKAHILRAEAFRKAGDYAQALASLDRAKATGTTDPWLLNGYGEYYGETGDLSKSFMQFWEVQKRGPGTTPSERKAYVKALFYVGQTELEGIDPNAHLKWYADLALRERHPLDGWTPADFANMFVGRQLCDDAIRHAREAVKTQDTGVGRIALASSLSCKAAALHMSGGAASEIRPLIAEAKAIGFDRDTILRHIRRFSLDRQFEKFGSVVAEVLK